MTKKWKTKWAVWDDLRTALNPEKKLRTSETEIYRYGMSNGTWDHFEVSICMSRVWVLESWWQRGVRDTLNFCNFCAPEGSKVKNRAPKNCFRQKFDQNYFFGDVLDFRFLGAAFIHIFGFRQIWFFTILLSKVLDQLKYLVLLELNLKYYIQSGVLITGNNFGTCLKFFSHFLKTFFRLRYCNGLDVAIMAAAVTVLSMRSAGPMRRRVSLQRGFGEDFMSKIWSKWKKIIGISSFFSEVKKPKFGLEFDTTISKSWNRQN